MLITSRAQSNSEHAPMKFCSGIMSLTEIHDKTAIWPGVGMFPIKPASYLTSTVRLPPDTVTVVRRRGSRHVDVHAGMVSTKAHSYTTHRYRAGTIDASTNTLTRRKHRYTGMIVGLNNRAETKNPILQTLTDKLGHLWCHEPLHHAGASGRQVIDVDAANSALFEREMDIGSGPEHV